MSRNSKLLFWYAVVSAAILALFWVIWYAAIGSIPATDEIRIRSSLGGPLHLPFAVSRWWDVLFGPLMVIGWVLSQRYRDCLEERPTRSFIHDFGDGLSSALMAGICMGLLVNGLAFGPAYAIFMLTFLVPISLVFRVFKRSSPAKR